MTLTIGIITFRTRRARIARPGGNWPALRLRYSRMRPYGQFDGEYYAKPRTRSVFAMYRGKVLNISIQRCWRGYYAARPNGFQNVGGA